MIATVTSAHALGTAEQVGRLVDGVRSAAADSIAQPSMANVIHANALHMKADAVRLLTELSTVMRSRVKTDFRLIWDEVVRMLIHLEDHTLHAEEWCSFADYITQMLLICMGIDLLRSRPISAANDANKPKQAVA